MSVDAVIGYSLSPVKLKRLKRSPSAGLFTGAYELSAVVIGFGKLLRLRQVIVGSPQSLDELHDRNVIEGLNEAGVIIAAAFIEGDEDRRVGPRGLVGLDRVYDFLSESCKRGRTGS